jgi:polar amino acid transport system substrate-binding protein
MQNGTMRVGFVENDPWARMEEGHASGVEVELLKDFARELGAEASFVPGTTPALLEAAKEAEVDVLIGGFTSTSPGVSEGKEAGATGSYLTTRFVVGVPSGRPTFDDLSGREIAVERIDATTALLKEEGAVPVPVDDLSMAKMPVAAYRWQLEAWGFKPSGVELPEEEHVMAVFLPLGCLGGGVNRSEQVICGGAWHLGGAPVGMQAGVHAVRVVDLQAAGYPLQGRLGDRDRPAA